MSSNAGWWAAALEEIASITPVRLVLLHAVPGEDVVIDWANRAAADALGHPPGALDGRLLREVYPPDDARDVEERLRDAREHGQQTYEAVRDLPKGRQSLQVTVLPLDDHRFAKLGLDLSPVREAKRQLEQVTRVAGIGAFRWNVVDETVVWSDQLYRLLGYEPAVVEASLERFFAQVHPDDLALVTELTAQMRAGDVTAASQYRIIRADDHRVRTVEVHAEATRDEHGGLVYLMGTVQDVTDRQQLQQQAEMLRQATDRQHTALQVHDQLVQGLSTIWLALQLDEREQALAAVEATTADAQEVVRALLAEVAATRGPVGPGDLVRIPDAELYG